MRVIVMFDLPVQTASERREYTKFRRYLIKSGFIMMQESVYCKLSVNSSMTNSIINNLRNNKPGSGLVQVIKITEKQYSKIECIVGCGSSDVLNTDERFVVL